MCLSESRTRVLVFHSFFSAVLFSFTITSPMRVQSNQKWYTLNTHNTLSHTQAVNKDHSIRKETEREEKKETVNGWKEFWCDLLSCVRFSIPYWCVCVGSCTKANRCVRILLRFCALWKYYIFYVIWSNAYWKILPKSSVACHKRATKRLSSTGVEQQWIRTRSNRPNCERVTVRNRQYFFFVWTERRRQEIHARDGTNTRPKVEQRQCDFWYWVVFRAYRNYICRNDSTQKYVVRKTLKASIYRQFEWEEKHSSAETNYEYQSLHIELCL